MKTQLTRSTHHFHDVPVPVFVPSTQPEQASNAFVPMATSSQRDKSPVRRSEYDRTKREVKKLEERMGDMEQQVAATARLAM